MTSYQKNGLSVKLEQIVSASKGNLDDLLTRPEITENLPSDDLQILQNKMHSIISGDSNAIHDLSLEVIRSWKELPASTKKGGINKLKYHWWGYQLFISHSTLKKITTIVEWVDVLAFIATVCNAPIKRIDLILATISVELFFLGKIDKGNGVVINYSFGYGIVLPQ